MTFRIVAGLRDSTCRREIEREETGSPVSMYARTMADRICRLRSLFGAESDICYTTHKCNTAALILCVAAAFVKLHTCGVCQTGEPGNANLPIGGLHDANREIGVPGRL